MVVAFERGRLVCEVGGDGTGFDSTHAAHFARDLREEHPHAIVAILPARPSWHGGWPWTTIRTPAHRAVAQAGPCSASRSAHPSARP